MQAIAKCCCSLEEEKAQLEEQLQTLEARCIRVLQQVSELRQDTDRVAELEKSFKEIADENDELKEYVQTLVERNYCKHCDSTYKNKGSTYDKVSYTKKQRKLKELKINTERTLWFLETFGFKLDKLSQIDLSGDQVTLQHNDAKKCAYHSLTEEDKDKVKNVVYIMDKFCVSDVAYHELSMTDQGLPRSYLIKQCRHHLNKVYSISRTPGEWPGAQLNFKNELNHQLSKQVNYHIKYS